MKQEYTDLIEKYFDSGLNTDEKKEFENLMANDEAFKQEFEEYKIVLSVIEAEGRNHLKQKLISLNEAGKNKIKSVKRLAIAAGLTGIILIAGYYPLIRFDQSKTDPMANVNETEKINKVEPDTIAESKEILNENDLQKKALEYDKQKTKADSLFAAHYKPFRHESLEPTLRGEETDNQRNIFLKLYWEEKYSEALLQYNKLSEPEKLNPNLRFQYAICLIENKQYKKAEVILEVLKAENKSRFGKDIENYLKLLKQRKMQD